MALCASQLNVCVCVCVLAFVSMCAQFFVIFFSASFRTNLCIGERLNSGEAFEFVLIRLYPFLEIESENIFIYGRFICVMKL